MNARYLSSTGGRFAHAALSLSLALAAYVSLSSKGPLTTRWTAVGIVALIVGFGVAAILSAREYFWYTVALGVLGPLAGFSYVFGLALAVGRGASLGVPFAALGAVVFVVGIVLGLQAPAANERAASEESLHAHA